MSFLLASLFALVPAPLVGAATPLEVETLTIEARDGLLLFAEVQRASDPSAPFLVLFHQARSSRGEYRPLIPRLAELGYGCLAVDLRVGGSSRKIANVTVRQARGRVKPPTYLDALPDIEDALAFAREHYAQGKLVACGSSFSASLLLHLAATKPEALDGVLAFSPGEYFTNLGKGENWVLESARGVRQPAFVSASLADGEEWLAIFEALGSTSKTAHRPVARGPSGAMALWEESPGSAECRQALEAFLQQNFPVPAKGSGG